MEAEHQTKLTAPEITNLWTQYQNDSLALCINTYMLKHTEKPQIRTIFENAVSLSQDHLRFIKDTLAKEDYPIPLGFTPEDVHLDAPPLFSETLCLKYLHEMTIHGLSGYAVAMTTCVRSDLRSFYTQCLNSSLELYNQSIDCLLSIGVYHRPPYIPAPPGIDFVKTDSFLEGLFGNRRSLNGTEMSNLYFNLKKSIITRAILIGFSQVAQSKEVRELLVRGCEIKQKHIGILSEKLQNNDLPAPPSWDSDVTDSTTPPFSDKLMMYHAGFLFSTAIAYYGAGLAASMRSDLILDYERIIPEDLKYAEDWADVMIKNEWMEQPPKALDREALARKH